MAESAMQLIESKPKCFTTYELTLLHVYPPDMLACKYQWRLLIPEGRAVEAKANLPLCATSQQYRTYEDAMSAMLSQSIAWSAHKE